LRLEAFLFLAAAAGAAHAGFDANGVRLGAPEKVVKQRFPNAHCQPLQWETRAAERRCDDSRAVLAGMECSVTFYLKGDAVEAFDVRVNTRDVERLTKLAAERYGSPPEEKRTEKVLTRQWRDESERALLSMPEGQRRASLLVWRGTFYDEIYKIR
jgi:hypothetical protein